MKKFITATLILAAAACGCVAQTVVKIEVTQNPLFEVSTNNVAVTVPATGATIGGDLVIKGGSGTYAFRWYTAAGTLLGTDSTLSVDAQGIYYLDIKDTCDCLQTVEFNVATTGIDEITLGSPAITPNPTDGPVAINGFDAVQITVVSMAGKLEAVVDNDGRTITNADLGMLPAGQHIVTLCDAMGRTCVTKLIKK